MIEVLSLHFLEGLRKTTKNSIRITDDYTEIRTTCLPDTGLERYHYVSPIDNCLREKSYYIIEQFFFVGT